MMTMLIDNQKIEESFQKEKLKLEKMISLKFSSEDLEDEYYREVAARTDSSFDEIIIQVHLAEGYILTLLAQKIEFFQKSIEIIDKSSKQKKIQKFKELLEYELNFYHAFGSVVKQKSYLFCPATIDDLIEIVEGSPLKKTIEDSTQNLILEKLLSLFSKKYRDFVKIIELKSLINKEAQEILLILKNQQQIHQAENYRSFSLQKRDLLMNLLDKWRQENNKNTTSDEEIQEYNEIQEILNKNRNFLRDHKDR